MTSAPPSRRSTAGSSSGPAPAPAPSGRPLSVLLVSNHRRFKVYFRGYPWARELARRGHHVDLMCHADTARWRTAIEEVDGFRIISSPDLLAGAARQGWDPYCALRRGAFLFGEGRRYDIIHCLDTRLAVIWPALAYARARGIPIVSDWIDWWGRGGLIAERRPLWYRVALGGVETWFEEHYRARLDGLSAISHALVERGIGLGCKPERCLVINGAADLTTFAEPAPMSAARDRVGLPHGVPVLCFSGLDVLIDLPVAIRAFEHVRRELPEARLLLVGPDEGDVRKAGVGSDAASAIRAIGKVPHGELPKVLPAADVFLLPYPDKIVNVGRWPNKIGDYMAVGRPTVTNPVGEMVRLFGAHDIGRLVAETPEAMAAAAVELLRNPSLAAELGARARSIAETELSWSTQIMRLEQWYRDILALSRGEAAARAGDRLLASEPQRR